MTDEEFVLAILGIVAGTAIVAIVFGGLFSLIKSWINRKSGSPQQDINPQFFKALGDFKKNTERRITNLESIVADLEEEKILVQEPNSREIEIEEQEIRNPEKEDPDKDSNLRNMLNE